MVLTANSGPNSLCSETMFPIVMLWLTGFWTDRPHPAATTAASAQMAQIPQLLTVTGFNTRPLYRFGTKNRWHL